MIGDYAKFSIDNLSGYGVIQEAEMTRIRLTTGQLVMDLPIENVRVIRRPDVGAVVKIGNQQLATVVSSDIQGRVLVAFGGDEFMTTADQITIQDIEKPVYLVHRKGVERGVMNQDGRVLRKGRFEKWDKDRVYDNEKDAYRALRRRMYEQVDKIYDRVVRIEERLGVL